MDIWQRCLECAETRLPHIFDLLRAEAAMAMPLPAGHSEVLSEAAWLCMAYDPWRHQYQGDALRYPTTPKQAEEARSPQSLCI